MEEFKMTGIIISKIKYFSFAKVLAMYGLLMAVLIVIGDLIYKLISESSYFMQGGTWGSWVLFAIGLIVLLPIAYFILAYIIAFILNIALKTAKGLELETL
jgi:hypothetical protein